MLQTVEIDGSATPFILDVESIGADRGGSSGTVAVIEVANGTDPGTVRVRSDPDAEPTEPTFAVAPKQQRSTTAWLPRSAAQGHVVDGPAGAIAQIWALGTST